MGAGLMNGISSRRSGGTRDHCYPPPPPAKKQGMGKAQGDVTWRHEVLELFRDADALRSLVVLQDGADGAGGSTHGGIQHVHKLYLWQGDTGDTCDMGKAKEQRKNSPMPTSLTLSIIFFVWP